jgi:hypothetical protein
VLTNNEGGLAAAVLSNPTHGQLHLSADGTFTYDPNAWFAGVDQFSYRASGDDGSADGQVLLYVIPLSNGPTATLDLVSLAPEEQIAATYAAFFGRAPDAVGFDFWVN